MDFHTMSSYQWSAMIPEYVILGSAIFLLIVDLVMPRRISRRKVGMLVGLFGIVLATIVLCLFFNQETVSILGDSFYLDGFAKAFKLILLLGGGLYLLLVSSYQSAEASEAYRAEFTYLFLTALLGGMLMASSADLITLFVGLELLSLSSYVLVAFRKRSARSSEAAMKYFINGGIASAITLFGFSYLYGLSGSTNLSEIANTFIEMTRANSQFLVALAFFLILVGFAFKIATVPFHMWAPDVYEGTATPVTGFLSVVSKSAGFIILARVVYSVFIEATIGGKAAENLFDSVQIYLLIIASLTILVGNIAALQQKRLKRILAYSSIAHAGYLLAAFSAPGLFTTETLWFYLLVYTFMTFGVFAIVQWIAKEDEENVSNLAGLYERSPVLGVGFAVLILSLAGFPGTAGFIAKADVLMNLLIQGKTLMVVAVILLVGTVISYVYYFKLLVQVFFRKTEAKSFGKPPLGIIVVVGICVIGTILLGVLPNLGLDLVRMILS